MLQSFFTTSALGEYFDSRLLPTWLLATTTIIIIFLFFSRKLLSAKQELDKEIVGRKQAEEVLLLSQKRLKLLNTILTGVPLGMSIEQIIKNTIKELYRHFPDLKVGFSNIDNNGILTVLHSIETAGNLSLEGYVADLTIAPDYFFTLANGQKFIVENVAKNQCLVSLASDIIKIGNQAILEIPLRDSSGLVGVLGFYDSQPRNWSEYEINTITEVANYLIVAIRDIQSQQENKQIQVELRESEAFLRTLYQVAVARNFDFEQRIQYLLAMGCQTFGVEFGILARVKDNRYHVTVVQAPDNSF